jgi:mono/diheme cytochrome c family protein
MPAWGVESGKGVLNTQGITDLVAYLDSIQITSEEAKQRSTKALNKYKEVWAKNAEAEAEEAVALQATADKARADGKSVDVIAALQADADEQKQVAASAAAWSAQVDDMNDGEILFRLNCARCHTKGASYYDPNNIKLPPPSPPGSGAFGPNLTGGSTLIQFPNLAGEQEQFEWVARGAPPNELYGQRGISSGRMPHFISQLTQKQIDAIIAYERSL